MGKGFPRALGPGTISNPALAVKLITVSALPLTVAGAAGDGFGSNIPGDFPAGNIFFFGAIAYMQFDGPTSGSLVDTWEGDYGIGTTPASDGTLTAADVVIVPSTALAAATAELSPKTRGVEPDGSLSGQVFDNTDGSLEINMSLLIDDADISADGIIMTCTGEIYLLYIPMGDD